MKKTIHLLLLKLLILTASLGAQEATGLIYTAPMDNGEGVQIKWLTKEIAATEGYNVFRRITGTNAWGRLNSEPLKIGKVVLPEAKLAADSSLLMARNLVLSQAPADIPGMARFNLVTFAITDQDFARFLGIHFDDYTASPGIEYEYEVRTLQKGREVFVGRSITVSADGEDGFPQAPTLTGEYNTDNEQVSFNWEHNKDIAYAYHIDRVDPISGERLRVNPRPIVVLSNVGDQPEYNDPTPGDAQAYRYELSSIDFLGRVSPRTTSVVVELPDLLPPEPPTNPASDNSVDKEITLSWTPSASKDTEFYRVYRAPTVDKKTELVGETKPGETHFTDNKMPGYGYYYYEVKAVDAAGNESGLPMYHIANATDLYPPASPKGVTISAKSGKIDLKWQENQEGDLAGYVVMRSIDVAGTNDWGSLHVEASPDNYFTDKLPRVRRNEMVYTIVAMDTTGNRSELSEIVRIAMPDEIPPPVPFLQSISTSGDSVFLNWGAVLEGDMKEYDLQRKTGDEFISVSRPMKEATSFVDVGLKAGLRVTYRLVSVDTTGNASEPSAPLTAKVVGLRQGVKTIALDGKYRKRDEAVNLKWTGANGKSYVFRRSGDNTRFLPISSTITDNQFLDKPGKAGRFDYLVKTYYPDGSRADSGVLTVVIK